MFINEQIQDMGALHARTALHGSATPRKSGSDEIPQLDTSTVSSCCADDDGSVSSLSTAASASHGGVRPRALFTSYWEKNGGRRSTPRLPSLPDEVTASFESNQSTDEVLPSNISYEDIIQESTAKRIEITARSRRRIFGQVVASTSVPLLHALAETGEFRKTKSTSALRAKKGCLRSSVGGAQDRRPSDASVTFSPKVDVRIFETPTLQWAAKGWSKWFA